MHTVGCSSTTASQVSGQEVRMSWMLQTIFITRLPKPVVDVTNYSLHRQFALIIWNTGMHCVSDTGDVEQHVISTLETSAGHIFSGKKWNSLTSYFLLLF